jgi:allantoinase
LTPEGLGEAAVLIRGETIVALVNPAEIPAGWPVEDVGDLAVMPGLVDTHVHINEPGRTGWEGFDSATRSAAAGGITTLVDMPLNSSPVTTTTQALEEKLAAARGKLWVDCGYYGGVVPGNADHVKPLAHAGVLGFKAFLCHSGIDEFPNVTEADLRATMPAIARSGLPLFVHAELTNRPARIPEEVASNPRSYRRHLHSRPEAWEYDAIYMMIDLCKEYQCRTHIVHLAGTDALARLAHEKEHDAPVTVETCPHYLYFAAEGIPDGDPRFKCAPPIRENWHRERLWLALREGIIDTIGSDHSPAPPDIKLLDTGDLQKAWGGIASLQLALSVVWTEAQRRAFTLFDVAEWMCRRPAQLVGLDRRKGMLATGGDADVIVFDPNATFAVDGTRLNHRHKATPYEGRRLQGRVVQTYLRGEPVYDDGRFLGEAHGRPLCPTAVTTS